MKLFGVVTSLLVLLTACDNGLVAGPEPDCAYTQVAPTEITLQPQETTQTRFYVNNCEGEEITPPYPLVHVSANPAVATVDAESGLVTGISPGITEIIVTEDRYDNDASVQVTVIAAGEEE